MRKLGIDVGSTTVKLVLTDEKDNIIYKRYERHMSSVFDKVRELLEEMIRQVGDEQVKCVITGSGGLALAEKIGARNRCCHRAWRRGRKDHIFRQYG